MSTIKEDAVPYEGTTVSGRYAWWAEQEIGHPNPNIDAYARSIKDQFARLISGEIDITQFENNTPPIEDETPLNYIRGCIIIHYPN